MHVIFIFSIFFSFFENISTKCGLAFSSTHFFIFLFLWHPPPLIFYSIIWKILYTSTFKFCNILVFFHRVFPFLSTCVIFSQHWKFVVVMIILKASTPLCIAFLVLEKRHLWLLSYYFSTVFTLLSVNIKWLWFLLSFFFICSFFHSLNIYVFSGV